MDTKSGHDDASKCYSFFAAEVLNLTLTSCTFPCFERVVPMEGINLPLPLELLCTLVPDSCWPKLYYFLFSCGSSQDLQFNNH